ncbi:MAG: peptide deformylase [Actinomycetota bacterium]|nr:peptide deformylase [Actinomycetota bacterium]
MSIRKIRVLGDPVLRKKSRAVSQIDDAVLALAKDMADSINTGYQAGVGLAAPQIGVNKRVIAINLEEDIQV